MVSGDSRDDNVNELRPAVSEIGIAVTAIV
jgi:hypothetical protein